MNHDKVQLGLTQVRDATNLMREGLDNIRQGTSSLEGDSYAMVDVACSMAMQTSNVVWQLYERFRQRFRLSPPSPR